MAITVHVKYLYIAAIGIVGGLMAWTLFRLFISFLCDVKLIRDKLYNTESESIKEFYIEDEKYNSKVAK